MRSPLGREAHDGLGLAGGSGFLAGFVEGRRFLERRLRSLVPACRGFQSASFRHVLVQLLRADGAEISFLNNDMQRSEIGR